MTELPKPHIYNPLLKYMAMGSLSKGAGTCTGGTLYFPLSGLKDHLLAMKFDVSIWCLCVIYWQVTRVQRAFWNFTTRMTIIRKIVLSWFQLAFEKLLRIYIYVIWSNVVEVISHWFSKLYVAIGSSWNEG